MYDLPLNTEVADFVSVTHLKVADFVSVTHLKVALRVTHLKYNSNPTSLNPLNQSIKSSN